MDIQKPMDRSVEDLEQPYSLWWLIMITRRAMYKIRSNELAKLGITPEEASVLAVIKAIGDAAMPSEISRWILQRKVKKLLKNHAKVNQSLRYCLIYL